MSYNKLILLGRPNVGKSSIFNIFSLVNKSIVLSHYGTTRNFIESHAKFRDIDFTIVDTPGYESEYFYRNIERKYKSYIEDNNNLLIFVVDVYNELDKEILKILRPYQDRLILLVNKVDLKSSDYFEFYQFGIKNTILVSASNKQGFDKLYDVISHENLYGFHHEVERLPLVSIIGRPNVGKSTLVNAVVENEVLITGQQAGLTTDSIKVLVDNKFILVDTAGVRRRSLIKKFDEKIFVKDSLKSLRQSDVVCIMIDAFDSITMQDARLINMAYDEGKGVILLINKCDLIDMKLQEETIYKKYNFLNKCKLFFISAISLRKSFKEDLYQEALRLYHRMNERISTAKMNKWVNEYLRSLKVSNGQKLVKYGVQVQIKPSIVCLYYSNNQVKNSGYINFIRNSFNKYFDYYGLGVKIQLKKKKNPYT